MTELGTPLAIAATPVTEGLALVGVFGPKEKLSIGAWVLITSVMVMIALVLSPLLSMLYIRVYTDYTKMKIEELEKERYEIINKNLKEQLNTDSNKVEIKVVPR